ncbi:hypothetical protein Tco_0219173, partial [Tanacetum coccineum]
YGYQENYKNKDKTGQDRARDQKEREKTSSTVPSDFIGPARYSFYEPGQPIFDVLVGMDRLSKRKFVIVCHEKVVEVPLEGSRKLRVQGERTLGAAKALMNAKTRVSYDLVIFREEHQCRLLRREAWSSFEVSVGITEEGEVDLRLLCETSGRIRSTTTPIIDMIILRIWKIKMDDLPRGFGRRCRKWLETRFGFDTGLASSSRWTKSPVLWAEIRESSLTGPELVLDTTDKVVLIKEKLKAVRDRQKSYADKRRKPLEFEVGDRVLLKVSPWKGVVCFLKKGKLAPRYIGPFEILERIGPVAYRLRLPEELSSVHDTFHVSNLKKCLADANLHVSLNEIKN